MKLNGNLNQHSLSKHELERILLLLNKNLEVFKYLVLKNANSKENNRIQYLQAEEKANETIEEWVSNQEIKIKKSRRTLVDIVEQWVENEVQRDMLRSLDAKYAHTEVSTKNLRELGVKLIAFADQLEGR